jgi:hypothetical protein
MRDQLARRRGRTSRSKRTSATPNIAIEPEKIERDIARSNAGDFYAGSLMSATWEDFITSPGLSLLEAIEAAREAQRGKD